MKSLSFWSELGLAALAGLMLAWSFPDYNLTFLVYLFPVPLLFALEQQGLKRAFLIGSVSGWVAPLVGFYWIGNWATLVLGWPFPMNSLVTLACGLLMAPCTGLISLLYAWTHQRFPRAAPVFFPFYWCTLFSVYPLLFPFHLADSQGGALWMLQPLEWTGVWGFDFVALLIGSSLYGVIKFKKQFLWPFGLVVILVLCWAGLGWSQLKKWDDTLAEWPHKQVGLVQTNRPASIHKQFPEPGYTRQFPLEMDLTRQLQAQGVDLVIWPEGAFYGYAFWKDVKQSFDNQISRLKIPLLFVDTGVEVRANRVDHYNTTFLISAQGINTGYYHKRHLVPFGETTPFLADSHWARALLGDFLATLQSGEQDKTFKVGGLLVVPKICYEILFPIEVAEAIGEKGAGKVLLVQSQDGWYGLSSQPQQHLAASQVRAIENRVPLIHSINNGPSAVILPNGRFAFKAPAFKRGAFVASFPYNPAVGGSFYSQHPGWMINLLRGLTVLLLIGVWKIKKRVDG